MTRVAISQHGGRVSPVFDVAASLLVVDTERGEAAGDQVPLRSADPFSRAGEVRAAGVALLICGAISRPLETALESAGVKVVAFVCGPVDEILAAARQGRLVDDRFRMPGCCRRRRKHGRGGR